MNKKYLTLSLINFLLGIGAICLYLPYTLDAFNVQSEWLNFAPDILKQNYTNTLVYFGIFLLLWVIVINITSILSHVNKAKIAFKLSSVIALILPLVYVLAIKYDWALQFWIDNIAKNIKMISNVLLCVSFGSLILGLVLNFINKNHANLYHIIQAVFMCLTLALLVAVNGWCGWDVSVEKMFGLLMGAFAIYLPTSAVVLYMIRNKRI